MTIENAYKKYAQQLLRSILKLVPSHEEAQDILHDAFVRAQLNWEKRNPFSPIKWWLEAIVKNLAIDYLRKQKHYENSDKIALVDGSLNVEEDIILKEQIKAISPSVKKLSPRQRQVLTMYIIDRSSITNIATTLGIKEKVVKMYLNRAKKRLLKLVA